jgi:hypothetical protein
MCSTRLAGIGAATMIALAATAPTATAQTSRTHLGPRIGYNFDAEAISLGGQLSFPIARRLEFYPSADITLVDEGSMFGVNLDIKYRMPAGGSMEWLYLGTGLGIVSRSVNDNDNTDTGLNLFLGAESLRGRVHPFIEGRVLISDGSTAQLVGGLNFTL